MQPIRKLAFLLCLLLLAFGCTADVSPSSADSDSEPDVDAVTDALVWPEITFEPFSDPAGIGGAGLSETKLLITSNAQYHQLFGHSAPPSVSFAAGDQVLFYSAGAKPTTGYTASFVTVARLGWFLRVYTRLESPGESCKSAKARTIPYALAKVRVGAAPYFAQFAPTQNVTHECAPDCDDLECEPGTHCELKDVVCKRGPCPPRPVCTPDTGEPFGPFCGGIAGLPCPGVGECVDDPRDTCDPRAGGADCGGMCECNALGFCQVGYVWNSSPDVCSCERITLNPCALLLCPANMRCQVTDGNAQCKPIIQRDPCANFPCPPAHVCVSPADAPHCIPAVDLPVTH